MARIDFGGLIRDSVRMPTRVESGPAGIERDIVEAIETLRGRAGSNPVGVGVGIAGQIDATTGSVHFSPNLDWREVPLRADLEGFLSLPTIVTNDVRAITWGEWVHGAGQGLDDIVCLFVGTGIGGGVVSGGRILSGCTNTAGELGHMTISIDGPLCTCGNHGCLEAMAGGWAIARSARELLNAEPEKGRRLVDIAGAPEAITAETVSRAAHDGDPLSLSVLDRAGQALAAGCVGLVNAFNPCKLILGGGVVDGVPELIARVRDGVKRFALPSATMRLEVVSGALKSNAGVIGAASLAMKVFGDEKADSGGIG